MNTENTKPACAELLPIELLASPFVRFAKLEAAGGILLLVSTIVANYILNLVSSPR